MSLLAVFVISHGRTRKVHGKREPSGEAAWELARQDVKPKRYEP